MTATDPITEKTVRDRLLRIFYSTSSLIGVNVCGIGPYDHEMDMIRILPSDYAQEIEIKVSASDIRAEAKNKSEKHAELFEGCTRIVGHKWAHRPGFSLHTQEQMEAWKPEQIGEPYEGQRDGMSAMLCRYQSPIREFYIAVPSNDLADVALSLMPEWAGVIVADGARYAWADVVYRKATKLPHARKINEGERQHFYHRMYCRYWQQYHDRGGVGRG